MHHFNGLNTGTAQTRIAGLGLYNCGKFSWSANIDFNRDGGLIAYRGLVLYESRNHTLDESIEFGDDPIGLRAYNLSSGISEFFPASWRATQHMRPRFFCNTPHGLYFIATDETGRTRLHHLNETDGSVHGVDLRLLGPSFGEEVVPGHPYLDDEVGMPWHPELDDQVGETEQPELIALAYSRTADRLVGCRHLLSARSDGDYHRAPVVIDLRSRQYTHPVQLSNAPHTAEGTVRMCTDTIFFDDGGSGVVTLSRVVGAEEQLWRVPLIR